VDGQNLCAKLVQMFQLEHFCWSIGNQADLSSMLECSNWNIFKELDEAAQAPFGKFLFADNCFRKDISRDSMRVFD
jgi:hypothetical protein